jgi:chromate transporter
MAIHIGKERGGWRGLIVAGVCFILPAVIITGLVAVLYKEYAQLPEANRFLYGIKPAIIAIILGAIFPLAKQSLKSVELWLTGVVVLVLSFYVNEIFLMFGAGFAAIISHSFRKKNVNAIFPLMLLLQLPPSVQRVSNIKLFLIFLKIGAILYGSGYVLFAFLDAELVTNGLLTRKQLIDAIAVGQFTPGPVFSAVTFIGYQLNGWKGAMLSTVAIFLPAFVFVALLNPLVKKIRTSKLFSAFLDAVNVASVAIIVAVCITMGREVMTDWRTVLIALLSIVITFGFRKVNSAWIVVGGAGLGYLLSMIG